MVTYIICRANEWELGRWRPEFIPRAVHTGYMVDEVIMENAFDRVLQFSPSATTSPMLFNHMPSTLHCEVGTADHDVN